MFLTSWRKLVQQVRRNSGASRRGKKSAAEARKSRWLWLEPLEERTLLSTFVWNGVSGSWNDGANWTKIENTNANTFPNAAGDVAMFTGAATITNSNIPTYTAAQDVTVDAPVVIGELVFATYGGFVPSGGGSADAASGNVTISGASAITLNNSGFGANSVINAGGLPFTNASSHTISAPITVTSTPLHAVVGSGFLSLSGANTIGNTSSFTANGSSTSTESDDVAGTLVIEGANSTGSAALSATNYGSILINRSKIVGAVETATGAGTAPNAASVTVNAGGRFVVDDRFGTPNPNRLSDTAAITLNGGTFNYIGNTSSETVGPMAFNNGHSVVQTSFGTAPGTLLLNVSAATNGFTRAAGTTVSFIGTGLGTASNQIKFATDPSSRLVGNNGGIFPFAVVGSTFAFSAQDFATYTVANGVAAFGAYKSSLFTGTILPGDTIKLTQSETLPSNITVNALLLTNTGAVVLNTNSLTLGAGALMNTVNFANPQIGGSLIGGSLVFGGTGEGIIFSNADRSNFALAPSTPTLTINSEIGGSNSLTVSGNLTLPDANSYSGSTTLNRGRLTLGNNGALGSNGTPGNGGTFKIVGGVIQSNVSIFLGNPYSFSNSNVTFNGNNNFTFAGNGTISSPASGGAPASYFTNLLTLDSSGQINMSGTLSGAGSIATRGLPWQLSFTNDASNLYITGNNTFSGGVTLLTAGVNQGGGLVVGHNNALGTGPLTFAGGNLFDDASVGVQRTIPNPLVFGDESNRTVTNLPANTLQFIGGGASVFLSGSAAGGTTTAGSNLKFTGNGTVRIGNSAFLTGARSAISAAVPVEFSGIISGTGKIDIRSRGTVTFSGVNTYSGGTVLNTMAGSNSSTSNGQTAQQGGALGFLGTLAVTNNSSLGVGPLTFIGGALQNSTNVALTFANALQFAANPTLLSATTAYAEFKSTSGQQIKFQNSGTNNTTPASFTHTANLIVNTPVVIDAPLTGDGNLNLFSGTSTLTLTQTNTYTGATVVNGGTLVLTGANGALTDTSAMAINAGGTLTLDNNPTNNNDRINDFALVKLNGGTLRFLGNDASGSFEGLFAVELNAGHSTIFSQAGAAGITNLDIVGGFTNDPGATVTFEAGAGQFLGLPGGNNAITTPFSLSNFILPFATVKDATTSVFLTPAGGGSAATVSNPSGFNMATVNSFADGITAFTDYISLGAAGQNSGGDNVLVIPTSVPGAINSAAINSLLIVGDGLTVAGNAGSTLTVNSGVVATSGIGITLSVPNLSMAAAEGQLRINAGTFTVNSRITGTEGLTISSGGILTLNADNAYTGDTQTLATTNSTHPAPTWTWLNSGTLILGSTNAIPVQPNATMAGGALTLISGALSSTQPVALANPIIFGKLSASDTTQTIPPADPDFTLDAASGSVTTVGTKTINFSGDTLFAGYSAGVTIDNGVNAVQSLSFGGSGLAGTFTLSLNDFTSAPITYDSSAATLQARIQAALDGMATIGALNTLVNASSGTNVSIEFQATLGKQAFPLIRANSSLTGTTPSIIVANTTVGEGGLTMAGVISGNGQFFKDGVATLFLTATNLYTGMTVINSGVLNLQSNGALGASAVGSGTVIKSAATLQLLGGAAAVQAPEPLIFQGGTGVGGYGVAHNLSASFGTLNAFTGRVILDSSVTFGGDIGTLVLTNGVYGSADITKLGTHQLRFDTTVGQNYGGYTGQLNINNGVFIANGATAVGPNIAGTVVADGATIQTVNAQGGYSGEALTLQGEGQGLRSSGGLDVTGAWLSAATTWTGDIVLAGDTTLTATGTLTISGRISGNANLFARGGGALVYQAPMTYTGATQLGLTLSVNGSGQLLNTSGINLNVRGGLTIDNRTTVIADRIGDGIQTEINGGTLTYLGSNRNDVRTTETLGSIFVNRGAATFAMNPGAGSNALAAVTVNGLSRAVGGTLTFDASVQPLGSALNQLYINNGVTLTNGILPYASVLNNALGQNRDMVTYGVTGITPFSDYITNTTSNSAGRNLAQAGPTDNVKLTSGLTLSANRTFNSLVVQGGITNQLSAGGVNYTLGLTSGSLVTTGGTGVFTGGTLDFGAAEGIIQSNTTLNVGSTTVPTVIAGANGLTMSGVGAITLNSNNTYTGNTVYNGQGRGDTQTARGNLILGAIGALSSSTLIMNGGVLGTVGFGNFGVIANNIQLRDTVVGFGTGADANRVTLTGQIELIGKVQIVVPNSAIAFIRGPITGAGTLVVDTMNAAVNTTLVLEGDNTYSGGTLFNPNANQQVVVNSNTAFGSGPINWFGGIMAVGNLTTPAVSTASGTSGVTIANAIIMTDTGTSRIGDAIRTGGGSVSGLSVTPIRPFINFTGPITVTGNARIQVDNGFESTISGVISGTGNLSFVVQGGPQGGARLALTNANTMTGGFTLASNQDGFNGTLVLSNNAALGSGLFQMSGASLEASGNLVINNPMKLDVGNLKYINVPTTASSFTFNGAFFGTGSSIKRGLGDMTMTNLDTRNNNFTVSQGKLILTGAAALSRMGTINLDQGGILTLDNSVTNNSNRLPNTTPITFNGGTLNVIGNNSANASTAEVVGPVTLNNGFNTISTTSGSGAGASVSLTIGELQRGPLVGTGALSTGVGSVLNLLSGGTAIGSATNKVFVTTLPAANNGGVVSTGAGNMLPYSMVTGITAGSLDFVQVVTVGLTNSLEPMTGYVTDIATAGPTDVVKRTTTQSSLNAAYTIAGLLLSGDGVNINGSGSLALTSGMILNTNPTESLQNQINIPTLSYVKLDGISYVEGFIGNNSSQGLNFTASTSIGNIPPTSAGSTYGAQVALTIGQSAAGKLTLSGPSTYTGHTVLTGGKLVLANDQALGQEEVLTGQPTLASQNYLLAIAGELQAGAGGVSVSNDVRLSTGLGALVLSGANPLTFGPNADETAGGRLNNGPGGGNLEINMTTSSVTVTYAGKTSVTATGAGQNFTINNYSGTTTVTRGTLALSLSATVGGSGTVARLDPFAGPVVIQSAGKIITTSSLGNQVGNGLVYTINGGTLDISASTAAGTINSLEFTGGTASIGSVVLTLSNHILSKTSTTLALITGTTGTMVMGQANAALISVQAGAGALGLEIATAISGSVATTGFTKLGDGTLKLSGTVANAISGAVNVNEGTLLLSKTAAVRAFSGPIVIGNGLGTDVVRVTTNFIQFPTGQAVYVGSSGDLDLSSTGITAIQTLGSLEIRGGLVRTGTNASLTLGGIGGVTNLTGFAFGSTSGRITGLLNLGTTTPLISVLNSATANGLQITGVISGSGIGIDKRGPGTLELLGSTANTFSGNTIVSEGTLLLNKTGVAAVSGTIQVGDNQGGSGATKVDILKLGGASQIPSTASVTVFNSGLFDLNNNSQTLSGSVPATVIATIPANIALALSGGSVSTGTGTLTLSNDVFGLASVANQTPASISGKLALAPAGSPVTRNFDIVAGALTTAIPSDMDISAVISGTGHILRLITSSGASTGILRLTGNNTYTGATRVSAGTLLVDGSQSASAVTVEGGILGGVGTTGAVTVASGTVNPGDTLTQSSPAGGKGILSSTGALNFSAGGNLTLQLTSAVGAGIGYDRFSAAAGALTIGAATTLILDVGGAGTLTDNQVINGVILYSSRTGSFATPNISLINNPSGFQAILNYQADRLNITLSSAVTHISIVGPGTVTAGQSNDFTVTALNVFEHPALAYTGTLHFASSGTASAGNGLPIDSTLTSGVGTFAFVLKSAGVRTVTATDTVSASLIGTIDITVLPGPTTHYGLNTVTNTTAGTAFVIGVTALDQFENTATNYLGTIHFSSVNDPLAGFEPDSTLTNGVGFFAAILNTAGSKTITVTDTTTVPTLSTTTAPITVVAGQASHFVFSSVPGSPQAGVQFSMTVSARDQFDNTALNYAGTVHFSGGGAGAVLPGDATLASGQGSFNFTLKATGSQTVTASDVTTPSIAGSQNLNVTGGPATHLFVSAPPSTTAGNAVVFIVTAQDQFNNTVASFAHSVNFGSSDSNAFLQGSGNLTNGVGRFAIIFKTSGNQTVTATDATVTSINGTSNSVSVGVAALHHFGFTTPATAITGTAFNFTVAAQDQFNNTVPTYSGTVHFTSTDGIAVLPADSTLTSGSRVLSATLKTSGNQTLTATDGPISGTSTPAIAARGLVVTGNTVTPTANGFTAAFNKPFDPLPINLYDANSALGVSDVVLARNAIQTITFGTAGGFTNNSTFTLAFNGSTTSAITYTNTSTATLQTNIQNALNGLVTVGSGNSLVTALSTTSVTVMFQGARGFQSVSLMTSPSPGGSPNPVQVSTTVGGSSNLRGSLLLNATNTGLTFLLSSTGSGGVLPADVYQATIRSDSTGFKDLLGASLDGNNDGVTGDSMVTTFTVATTPTVILSVPDFARGPDSIYNVRIPNGPTGEEIQTITFTGTANGSTFTLAFNGQTSTGITYSTSVATLQSNIQTALESLSNISGPNDFNFRRADVLVTATDASNVTVRFQNVMGGFDQPQMTTPTATVSTGTSSPGVNTGIPISLVGGNLGSGVTAMTFDLVYDPALLTVTGAYSQAGGGSFTLVGTPSGGVAHFSYVRGGAPALTATATLGQIVATVPDSAESNFKTKQLLQLTNIVGTGAAATPVGNSGVQIVAFFGDANGDGKVTGGDAALVSRVNSGTDTITGTTQVGGLGAYRMLDPVVIVAFAANGNGGVTSGDVTLINSYLVASRTAIPTPPPITDMTLTVVGPDPTLSLPSDLRASAGETVVVPVNIDITRPGDSPGMMEAILALRYDTSVFTVSASDIHLGSVPSAGNGWQLRTAVNAQTGEIGINIYSMNPILTRGGGSLVTVSLHVREGAVAGASAINLVTAVNPTGNSEYVTSVNDSINQYILNPVVTDGFDAGVDGRVTVPAPLVSTSMTAGPQFVFTPGAATAEAAGFEPFEPVQLSAVVTSDVPEVVLEEVFSDFETAALYLAASGLGKSATQDTDMNHVGTSAHDLAMLWSAEGVAPQNWMSDDSLTVLGKSLRRGKRLLATDTEDGSEEAAGVEEFFAREGASRRKD